MRPGDVIPILTMLLLALALSEIPRDKEEPVCLWARAMVGLWGLFVLCVWVTER